MQQQETEQLQLAYLCVWICVWQWGKCDGMAWTIVTSLCMCLCLLLSDWD